MKRGKNGVSPVIATVLLIGMVIAIALIVFLWFRGMVGETITKFEGTNIQLVCADVQFDVSLSGNSVYLSNLGNVPIYNMKVKMSGQGSYETSEIKDLLSSEEDKTAWGNGLNQGGVFSGNLNLPEGTESITLIPVLIGNSDKGKRTYTCEDQYGYEVLVQ
jgi:flagellin-like protein